MTCLDRLAHVARRTGSLTLGLGLAALALPLAGCSDAYECTSQSVGGTPVEGCTDLFGCDYAVCEISFGGCDNNSMPSMKCEGDSCTCFDHDDEIGQCAYTPDQCPSGLDIEFTGDDTEAMTFFESCCGVGIDRG